jgi:SAM-dependent methyltransferase
MAEKLLVPIYLPEWMHGPLRSLKRAFIPAAKVDGLAPKTNIYGERDVEWSFLSSEMPEGHGEALEFGCENAYMSLVAAQKGYRVLANDLQEQNFLWQHPNVQFCAGDFLKLDLPKDHFDLVINCSSVEHVGIAGRYGITAEQSEGDIEVVQRFAEILKPGGLLLMTAPCGQDAVMAPWCRVYGESRLPRLLAPLRSKKELYWIKNENNQWVPCSREVALTFKPYHNPLDAHGCSYALGGFVLTKEVRQ